MRTRYIARDRRLQNRSARAVAAFNVQGRNRGSKKTRDLRNPPRISLRIALCPSFFFFSSFSTVTYHPRASFFSFFFPLRRKFLPPPPPPPSSRSHLARSQRDGKRKRKLCRSPSFSPRRLSFQLHPLNTRIQPRLPPPLLTVEKRNIRERGPTDVARSPHSIANSFDVPFASVNIHDRNERRNEEEEEDETRDS